MNTNRLYLAAFLLFNLVVFLFICKTFAVKTSEIREIGDMLARGIN